MVDHHYPIIETLAEFRIAPESMPDNFSELVFDAFKDRYPVRNQITVFRHEISHKPGNHEQSYSETPRYQFFTEDRLSLVQVSNDVFTINRLAPYYGWEAFVADIQDGFVRFMSSINKPVITGINLQYINKIAIPNATPLESLVRFMPVTEGTIIDCHCAATYIWDTGNGIIERNMTITRESNSAYIMFLFTAHTDIFNENNYMDWINAAHFELNKHYQLSVIRENVERRG